MAVTSATGLGAAVTPVEAGSYYLDALTAQSVFLRSGVRVVRTDKDSISIPRLLTDGAANWTSEGAAITESTPNGDAVLAVPRKLASLVTVTNETIDDSDPAVLDIVGTSLARACALQFDLGAFYGTGVAPQPRGLANVAGIQTVSSGANGSTPLNLDVFADAIGLLDAANAAASVIVMNPRTWKTLSKIKETSTSTKPVLNSDTNPTDGVVRALYGVPVLLTSQLPITETVGTSTDTSSAFVYDASQVLAVLRKDASVVVDRSVLFSSDQSQVRLVMRADVAVANPAAVVRVTGLRAV